MDTNDAAHTLADLQRVTARTRASLYSIWYPLVVFGALTLAVAGLASFAPSAVTVVFALVGFFACVALVQRHYGALYRRLGIAPENGHVFRRVWIGYFVGGSILVSIADNVGGNGAALVVQGIVFALFYLALARLTHSRLLAGIGLGAGVFCCALAAAGPGNENAVARFVIGAALLLCGLYARERPAAA